MIKSTVNTPARPLTFEQRLRLVKAEVQARYAPHPQEQQNAIRAHLWVNWLKRNFWEVA